MLTKNDKLMICNMYRSIISMMIAIERKDKKSLEIADMIDGKVEETIKKWVRE